MVAARVMRMREAATRYMASYWAEDIARNVAQAALDEPGAVEARVRGAILHRIARYGMQVLGDADIESCARSMAKAWRRR